MAKKRKKAKAKSTPSTRGYEAALSIPSRRHPIGADQSQDAAAEEGFSTVREWARYLDENSDLAIGVLDQLVAGTVGTGIVTIPRPLRADGSIDEELGAALMTLWKRWCKRCDVTGTITWAKAQALAARAWKRDGEQFVQHVMGREQPFPFERSQTPYRFLMLESDWVPWELTTRTRGENGQDVVWRQGIRTNAWGAPTAYGVHFSHPGDRNVGLFTVSIMPEDVKVIPAPLITHLKNQKRMPATRGMSILHGVISRLYDIKDLEESERIKNRILASWTAAIRRSPDIPGLDDADTNGDRYLEMAGGSIIDTLAPGEDIVGVGPEYPVTGMDVYIADQIRRIASGTRTRYSSISKRYDGTYSAQRQELVEGEVLRKMDENEFVDGFVKPIYDRFVLAAVVDGQVRLSSNDPEALELAQNAEHYGPAMPWIDPAKEAAAWKTVVEEGFGDLDEIRIKRGRPDLVGTPAPRAPQPRQLSLIDDDDEEDAA